MTGAINDFQSFVVARSSNSHGPTLQCYTLLYVGRMDCNGELYRFSVGGARSPGNAAGVGLGLGDQVDCRSS